MSDWYQVVGDYPYCEEWNDVIDAGYGTKYSEDKKSFEYEQWYQVLGEYPYKIRWTGVADVGYGIKYSEDKRIWEYEQWYQVPGGYPYKLMWKDIPPDPDNTRYRILNVILKNYNCKITHDTELEFKVICKKKGR